MPKRVSFEYGRIKESSLLEMVCPVKYLPASVTGKPFLPQMGIENFVRTSSEFESKLSLQIEHVFLVRLYL
jgi:hypothetical protein